MTPAVALIEALQTAIVVGGCVYALLRVIQAAEPILVRLVGVQEEVAKRVPGKSIAIPTDLEAYALREGEEWARDATRTFIRETYEKTGDWNQVRRIVMEHKT